MEPGATCPVIEFPGTPSDTPSTTDVLGVNIDALTMEKAVGQIERWVSGRSRQYVCICNVDTVMQCHRDPAYKRIVNAAGMRTPDGMPLVWLSHRAGHKNVTRLYGPDLMLELCARSEVTGHRHFFYGGGSGITEALVEHLRSQFPRLQVAGAYSPGHLEAGEIERQEVIDRINASGADIVWVGLGTPKQDWWIANHRALLDAPVLIAVGAAFDFLSGHVRQAPRWMQGSGLEWLFRLSQDPKRLWRRYVFDNIQFIGVLVWRAMRGRLLAPHRRTPRPGGRQIVSR